MVAASHKDARSEPPQVLGPAAHSLRRRVPLRTAATLLLVGTLSKLPALFQTGGEWADLTLLYSCHMGFLPGLQAEMLDQEVGPHGKEVGPERAGAAHSDRRVLGGGRCPSLDKTWASLSSALGLTVT